MIQNYNNLAITVQEINRFLAQRAVIQKVYATSCYVVFQLRVIGETKFLCFGRGAGEEGLYMIAQKIPAEIRVVDRAVEFFRKYFIGSQLVQLKLDDIDRILLFCCKSKKMGLQEYYLFWKGRDFFHLYLSKMQYKAIAKSNFPIDQSIDIQTQYNGFNLFDAVGRCDIAKRDTKPMEDGVKIVIGKEKQRIQNKTCRKKNKNKIKRKKDNILKDYKKVEDFLKNKEKLINGDESTIMALGEKFKLRDLSLYKKRDYLLKKIKNYEVGLKILNRRLKQTQIELNTQGQAQGIVHNPLKVRKPFILSDMQSNKCPRNEKQKKQDYEKGFRIIKTDSYQLGIGLSAQGNDALRRVWAKKNDWWLHIAHGSGAHVVVKYQGDGGMNESIFKKVANLMVVNNSGTQEIELVYTKVKYVRGIKNNPGKVVYSNEKRVKVIL